MIIFRIVMIDALAKEPRQKKSVDAFVVMKRDEIEMIDT
jgi:hypothetical protein